MKTNDALLMVRDVIKEIQRALLTGLNMLQESNPPGKSEENTKSE